MPLLIDTFNVLHVTGVLPPDLAGVDVMGLADLIGHSRYGGDRVWLICDGRPPRGPSSIRSGSLVVQYVGPGTEADARIEHLIATTSSPRRMTVVSSDHRIRRAARARRCRWLSSDQFLEQLAADARHGPRRGRAGGPRAPGPRASVPLSSPETEAWIERFGLTTEFLDLRAAGDGAAPQRSPAPSAPSGTIDGARSGESPAAARTESAATTPEPRPAAGADPAPVDPARADTTPPPAPSGPPASSHTPGRPLEHVTRLEDIDPEELDRFDMTPWLDGESESRES